MIVTFTQRAPTAAPTKAYQPNACKTQTGVALRTQARKPNMLKWALRYAEIGIAIFPLHNPLFDHPKGYKCTCEQWRHSDDCKAKKPNYYLLPDQHCGDPDTRTVPGKHPRGVKSWTEESTIDRATIRAWWTKYPDANIAIDCGKNGWLVLDEDKYKAVYGDLGDLLSPDEQETVRQLSGSHKGQHLVYAMPPGKHYGNQTGHLPAGIDIRGQGGFIVAAPSLHHSGNRYEWLEGYEPTKIELQVVPQALQDILDQAERVTLTKLATFSPADVAKPDLKRFRLSDRMIELVMHPAPFGERSATDQSVILALVANGASDDDIRAVFTHYPIGIDGHYMDTRPGLMLYGDAYLARSIGMARAHFAEHGHVPTVIDTTTGEVILLADLMEFCRQEITRRRLPFSQEQAALAIVQIFEHKEAPEAPLSARHISGLAAIAHTQATNALIGMPIYAFTRNEAGEKVRGKVIGRKANGLNQWFVVKISKGNGVLADTYQLATAMLQAYREDRSTKVHKGGGLSNRETPPLVYLCGTIFAVFSKPLKNTWGMTLLCAIK